MELTDSICEKTAPVFAWNRHPPPSRSSQPSIATIRVSEYQNEVLGYYSTELRPAMGIQSVLLASGVLKTISHTVRPGIPLRERGAQVFRKSIHITKGNETRIKARPR